MAKRKSPKQRKEERKKEKQRGQQYIIIGAVVLVAIFAAIIFALTSLPAEAPIPDTLDRYDAFLTSTTDQGYPLLGNPNAPVTVEEYSSFSCPGCLDFHDDVFPGLLPRIEAGQINFVYVPLQTGSVPNPEGAARTAICAGEQGQFWQMHDVLFFWHETYGNSAFQDGRIRTGVEEVGLDTAAFNRCFNNNSTSSVLNAAISEGIGSTPSIVINGVPVEANLPAIEEAISSNIGGQSNFESGLIQDATDDTETEVEATEAVEEATVEAEVTEAPDTNEATEAAEEATSEAEATAESE